MKTHDIGRAFWCVLNLTPDAPFAHRAPMHQARWPYLQGKTVIFKFGSKGLVLGWWSLPDPYMQEEQLLLTALRGHAIGSMNPPGLKDKPQMVEHYRQTELTFSDREDALRLMEIQRQKDAAQARL